MPQQEQQQQSGESAPGPRPQSTSAPGEAPRKQQPPQHEPSQRKLLADLPALASSSSLIPSEPAHSQNLQQLHNRKENTQVPQQQQQRLVNNNNNSNRAGDKKQQLGSLVRNSSDGRSSSSSDLLGSGGGESNSLERQQQQQRERHASLIAAEFADDSIRSQPSVVAVGAGQVPASPGKSRNNRRGGPFTSSPFTSSTSLLSNGKQKPQQQQQHSQLTSNDSALEASVSSVGLRATKRTHTSSPVHHREEQEQEARRLLDSTSSYPVDATTSTATDSPFSARHQRVLLTRSKPANNNNNNMSLASQTIKLVPAYFVAELVGTFLLVLIGDGTVAAYVLTRRPVDLFCACFAFGVGAMIASFVAGKLSGAHLNPAASVAFALDQRLKWELVPVYLIAQYMGGFLAALVLFLNYSEAITALDGGERSAYGANNSTGGIFATYPAPYVTVWGSLLDQIVGTAVLLFSLTAVGDKNNLGLEERFQPPIVALVVGLVCLAFNPNCGAIFNPARDLSPRLLTALFGYPGVWAPVEGTYWVVAGVVGPHIGAILGVFGYKYLIGTSLEAHRRHMQLVQNSVVSNNNNNSSGLEFAAHQEDDNELPEPKKLFSGGARLQSYNVSAGQTTTALTPPGAGGQRRHEMSDYGSAVVR